jgi:uncharacterized protein (TIGR03663 family)
VSTVSTKSRTNKKARSEAPIGDAGSSIRLNGEPPARPDLSERTWRISSIAIFCIAAFLRLYNLNLVPLHHDEGVNGNFLVRLVRDGAYQYDPANYHGPTLYYFAALIPWTLKLLFGPSAMETYGLNTVTIRLVPALFGLATIWLVLLLRKRVGTIAALSGALLLAISPGAVYLSRYFIHETLFVFFTLATVVAGLKFYEERNPVFLLLATVSVALLFATKETAMISAGVLVIALVSTHLYRRLHKSVTGTKRSKRKRPNESKYGPRKFVEGLGGPMILSLWIMLALLVFLAVNTLFYSSFFKNYPKGIYDALKTFDFWTKTGKEAHVHPLTTYLKWLTWQESPLLFLGAVGAAFAVWKPKNSFALFTALWAFGLVAAYSLVPYKTPWLTLNFIVPLAIVAGYAVQSIYELDIWQWKLPAALMLAAVAVSGYQTIDLNFFNYDNDNEYYVYVYAHTRRETLKLVDEINRIAQQTHEGGLTGITIVSPDYWPLPWYLRNYTRVGYFGRMSPSTEPIIIASESQRAEIESTFGGQYQQVPSGNESGSFPLRPGVSLLLYVRRDVFNHQAKSILPAH